MRKPKRAVLGMPGREETQRPKCDARDGKIIPRQIQTENQRHWGRAGVEKSKKNRKSNIAALSRVLRHVSILTQPSRGGDGPQQDGVAFASGNLGNLADTAQAVVRSLQVDHPLHTQADEFTNHREREAPFGR